MQEEPHTEWTIEEHIRAAVRPMDETARLTRALTASCWPSGTADRTDPVARGWLRMWGPIRVVVDVPACQCAQGRCKLCG